MPSLTFHSSLYPASAVQSAADAYGELATITVEPGEPATAVTISEIDADFADFPDEFADAFANHVLFEAVRARRGEGAS